VNRLAVVALACCTPAKHPKWATPKSAIGPAHRGEHPLHLDPGCTESGATPIANGDTVLIVTCTLSSNGDVTAETAYFIRRSAPDRGTSQQLGAWNQYRESGEYFQIDGATHDRVIVRHQTGGLDQIGETELRIYDPVRDAFTGQVIRGAHVEVVVAPGGASATAFVCEPARGGVYDLTKACAEQTGSMTKTIAID
jgi:hypothetical protein